MTMDWPAPPPPKKHYDGGALLLGVAIIIAALVLSLACWLTATSPSTADPPATTISTALPASQPPNDPTVADLLAQAVWQDTDAETKQVVCDGYADDLAKSRRIFTEAYGATAYAGVSGDDMWSAMLVILRREC